jgi:hypothetical protein
VSFIRVEGLIEAITGSLARVTPYDVLALKDQIPEDCERTYVKLRDRFSKIRV